MGGANETSFKPGYDPRREGGQNGLNRLAAVFESWVEEPEKFVEEALNGKPTRQQRQGLQALRDLVRAKEKRRRGLTLSEKEAELAAKLGISIMSGHGTGKDCFAAWAILWFITCFPFPKIPCTAPTGHQLKDVLWSEINKWLRNSLIKDFLTWQAEKLYWTEHKGKEWFAVPRTANPKASAEEQAETLQGFHEDHMMVVVDEASGVPDAVFRPLEGALTGSINFVLLIFNPTRSQGYAINSQYEDRARWISLRWNSEESELTDKVAQANAAARYGRDSNFYRIRVLGLPPKADSDVLIPWEWAQDAIDNHDLLPLDTDPTVAGFDVGGGGDESIILRRHGPRVFPLKQKDTADSEILTNWALKELAAAEPDLVMVDAIGIGWGIAGNLRARSGLRVLDINVATAASDDERFHRLRDELWWRVREKFELRQISLPNDKELLGELTTIKFSEEGGKIKVESKKDLKKRGLASPNRADALCLSYYYDTHDVRRAALARKSWRRAEPAASWRVQ
jgi:phage terminase large subunit